MNNKEEKSIKDQILGKLEKGGMKMRPKYYFVIRTILVVLTVVLLVLTVLFLISFVFFQLRFSGLHHTPSFGLPGVKAFVVSLPWVLIALIVFLTFALEYLLKKYSFTYKRPLIYSLMVVVVVVLVVGFVVSNTPLHDRFAMRAMENRLPVAGGLYREIEKRALGHAQFGQVTAVRDDEFDLETRLGERLTIKINERTIFQTALNLRVDDVVMVIGNKDNGTVDAVRIQKVPDEKFPMQRIKGRFHMMK